MSRLPRLFAALVLLAACADDEESAPAPPPAAPAYLSPAEHLQRASMALRGLKPSVEELEQVTADPAAIGAIVDGYLASDAFGVVVRDMYNEALLARVDYAYYPAGFMPMGPLAGVDPYQLNRSVQESPLRLVEHVVKNDRPLTEIVTADYVMADEVVAAVWGQLDYQPGGDTWQVSHWTDGRPVAGLLSDPWWFSRFMSTPSNANRGRANAVSKALLCYDFLQRDIEIDASINLADPAAVQNAVVDSDACASCHQALDPLAAFFQDFFPLYVPGDLVEYPFAKSFPIDDSGGYLDFYFPGLGGYVYGELRDPGYWGEKGETVADLGRMIADDPRFSLCAVQRFYGYFHQQGLDDIALARAAELQEAFIDGGFSARALARSIVLADDFRISHAGDAESAEHTVALLKARPDQLGPMIEDLTGFRWVLAPIDDAVGQPDLLADSFLGYQVIGGGIDAQYVTRSSFTFNAASSLLGEALAGEAAAYAVETDPRKPASVRRLFHLATPDDADPAKVREQLAWLHKRLYAEMVSADSPLVDETLALFQALYEHGGHDARRAWEGTLAAMLQDVRVATY